MSNKVVKQDGKYYQIAEGTGVFIEIDKDEYDKLRKEGATISPQKLASGGEVLKPISKVAGRLAKRGYGKAKK